MSINKLKGKVKEGSRLNGPEDEVYLVYKVPDDQKLECTTCAMNGKPSEDHYYCPGSRLNWQQVDPVYADLKQAEAKANVERMYRMHLEANEENPERQAKYWKVEETGQDES